MKKNKKLLSIGELSHLTGVHIKSLRYYDAIGILPPVYIDPDSNYRYYSFSQVFLVESIQFCVEIGIPLKEFNSFVSDDHQTIYYDKLFAYGKNIATRKVNQILQHLDALELIQEEIYRSLELVKHKEKSFYFEEKLCWIKPFSGKNSFDFNSELKQIILELKELNMYTVNKETGLVSLWNNGTSDNFIYVQLENTIDSSMNYENIILFPKGEYLCMECDIGDIYRAEEIFPHVKEKKSIVIEKEMFTRNYDVKSPRYELQCCRF